MNQVVKKEVQWKLAFKVSKTAMLMQKKYNHHLEEKGGAYKMN